jgi:hypothetical protein
MSKAPFHSTEITHHDDGSHTISHTAHVKPSKSPAFMERADADTYSAADGVSMISKLEHKLKIKQHGEQEEEPTTSAQGKPFERGDGDEE